MSKAAELAALIGSQTALSDRNLVINGAFQVAQRATSVTGVTGDGYQAVDRWQNQSGSLGTFTMSQSTTAPDGFGFSHKYDCTTADASPAGGDFLIFQHRIEAQNLQHLQYGTSDAKSITLSFYVRSNKTGTYIAELSHGDATSFNQQSYTINSANTWEKKTLTYVGQTSDAINNDTGIGMFIHFWLGSGSTYSSGTLNPNVWANTTAANRAAGQVNLADSTSNEWYITGIQLELGEQATPFEHRSFGDELARCQRYLETIHRLRGGVDGAGSTQRAGTVFQTTKRGTPTITGTIYDSVSDVNANGFSIQRSGNPADMSAGALADAEL
tara:strand:- start:143 stop:1126 length:984 start_codon:yes stop_codon:yes gene_type:complete